MNDALVHVWRVLPVFIPACLALAVLPGPATALFIQRTLRDGRAVGMAAVAGNELGLFCWGLASGLGLTALIAVNHLAYDALRLVGALVLITLGVQAWRTAGVGDEFGESMTRRLPGGRTKGAAFRASLISMAANPKAAIFAFTFFPQFLPKGGPVLAATVSLALVQVLVDTAYCVTFVLVVGTMRGLLARTGFRRRLERCLGAALVALGIGLATESR